YHRQQSAYAAIIGLGCLVVTLAAVALVNRLQRRITGPLSELATVARRVSHEQDFTLRAAPAADRELSLLVDAFNEMLDQIRDEVVRIVMTVRIESREEIDAAEQEMAQPHVANVHYQHADYKPGMAPEELLAPTAEVDDQRARMLASMLPKVGRNDPCPCGSGKKYKVCHGQLQ
ncbi:MAG: SEC-C metal-binding domain-containing protein, partial [Lacisediminimonas sp.]|nr:SEC-C metal-binding domain-containing protein [Lacisediminimonas sp.]